MHCNQNVTSHTDLALEQSTDHSELPSPVSFIAILMACLYVHTGPKLLRRVPRNNFLANGQGDARIKFS